VQVRVYLQAEVHARVHVPLLLGDLTGDLVDAARIIRLAAPVAAEKRTDERERARDAHPHQHQRHLGRGLS
jgi:hypothetical protein